MADDVFSAFGRGFVAFAHSRAADLTGGSFKDSGALITSLMDGKTGTTKAAFAQVKADIDQLGNITSDLGDALEKEIADGKAAVSEMAAELSHDPFGPGEVMRGLTALAKLLVAYDNALTKVAEKVSQKASGSMTPKQIRDDIEGMNAPIRMLLNDGAGAVTSNFDRLCQFILNIDGASGKLGERLVWDYAEKRLQIEFAAAGPVSRKELNFDGATLVAFFSYKTEIKAGIDLRTKLKAGLRNHVLLEKIMPGQQPTADADQVAITLDTHDGLTFGSGKDKRLILPARISYPAIELREFAIEQPSADNESNKNRVNIVFTVAGKLGDVFAVVVEGGGVTIRWMDGAEPQIMAKIPTGAGLRLKTPAIKGGGYLRYDEIREEYGGVFQLELAKIGITAIGLIGTKPFSLVIVIGVQFSPKIELGFGFTLSGLGGILAIERTLDSAALRDGLKDGAVDQILFPADPVAAAPQILFQLSKIFPERADGFVIGPIAQLGWGSQAGFVKARLGVVLSLPEPKIVILGAVQVGVPSADVEEKLRVVDLRAELMGEITPDYVFLKVSLSKSKLFKLEVTGDLVLFIQWTGEGAFALSVGGFFPGYEAPKQIGPMQRVAIKFAPKADWLAISVQAYLAVTSNTVQFGGRVDILVSFSKVKAQGWLQLDALFQWAPHFYFVIRIDAGISVSAFDVTLARVAFKGELSGDKPFRLEGHAEAKILFWTVPVDVGPITWGEATPPPAPQIDPIAAVARALESPQAWMPLLPEGAQNMVRIASDGGAAQPLFHPLGQIQLRQLTIPLEMDIDRVGSSAVTHRRINMRQPSLAGEPAGAVWPLSDRFPPGHFLKLGDQEVLARPEYEEHISGLGMGAAKGPSFSTAIHAGYSWNTVCPDENFATPQRQHWQLSRLTSHVLAGSARMMNARANPYMPKRPSPQEVALSDRGQVCLASAQNLGAVSSELMNASVAGQAVKDAARQGDILTTISAGFL